MAGSQGKTSRGGMTGLHGSPTGRGEGEGMTGEWTTNVTGIWTHRLDLCSNSRVQADGRVEWLGRTLLLWLHPLLLYFLPFQALLTATIKYDSKRTKTDNFKRQNIKNFLGRGPSTDTTYPSASHPTPRGIRPLDTLLLSDNSHPV